MGMPNDLLRAEREAQGLSQQDLADSIQQHEYATTGKELPVDKSYVSKWERGEKGISEFYAERLVAVLGKSRVELGLKDRPSRRSAASAKLGATPATDESRDVQRRQFNRLLRDFASGLTADPLVAKLSGSPSVPASAESGLAEGIEAWERTAAAIRRPGRVDEKTVEALEAVTVSHRRIYHDLSSFEFIDAVSGHLGAVMALLPVEQPEPLRRRLAVVAGEAAGLAAWLRYDLNDRRAMRECYAVSTSVLRQAGHPALSAYVQGFRSIVRAAEGEFHDALALARGAGGLAARSATATTRSWLAGLEAQARARMGDRVGCLRVLKRAEETIEQARPDDDPEWMDSFDHDRFLALAGSCYRQIGNLPVAERMLREALAALDPSCTRRRSEILLELGGVHLQQRELDEACRLAGDSMAAASEAGSVVGIRRVRLFRRQLDEWADTKAVVGLDERLASFL